MKMEVEKTESRVSSRSAPMSYCRRSKLKRVSRIVGYQLRATNVVKIESDVRQISGQQTNKLSPQTTTSQMTSAIRAHEDRVKVQVTHETQQVNRAPVMSLTEGGSDVDKSQQMATFVSEDFSKAFESPKNLVTRNEANEKIKVAEEKFKSKLRMSSTKKSSQLKMGFNLTTIIAIVALISLTDWNLNDIKTSQRAQVSSFASNDGVKISDKRVISSILSSVIDNLWTPTRRMLTRRTIQLAQAQYRPDWPSKALQQEIFLLNLEDGYFGCQVNESQDFLQLFELSRLCDGQTQCYLGTDEMSSPLKCNNRDRCGTHVNIRGQPESIQCVNGVCLDGLCYCNDGFGGKSCDIPDENECKYRPCDVFAHCTNTMGSYYCSCFPGYDGDGMHCQDINECEIPSLAALCSDNSECCNLPGHFVCKCKPGYQQAGQSQSLLTGAPSGNTTVQCTDIDECQDERACGKGALCENLPGSFRCSCPPGFTGDPSIECIDMDECRNNPCGAGAQCTNIPGGYRCSCAPGFERNPSYPANLLGTIQTSTPSPSTGLESSALEGSANSTIVACLDINECKVPSNSEGKSICGTNAQCINTPGAYFCQCPPNYTGNPKVACLDIDECASQACGPNSQCKNLPGGYKCECKQGYAGNAYSAEGCQDEDECLKKDACGLNAQCFNTLGSFQCTCISGYSGDPYTKCQDIDECANGVSLCGPGAQCHNLAGGYKCSCPDKYLARGSPEMGCERAAVDIGCAGDYDCTQNAVCFNSTCQCKFGYQINGIDCVDVDECQLSHHQLSSDSNGRTTQAPIKAFTRLNSATSHNANLSAANSICGQEASCMNTDGSYKCNCKSGYEKIDSSSAMSKCRDVNECDTLNPCGQNSKCFNTDGSFKCACNDGFIPIDMDPMNGCKSPCDGVNCGQHATCKPHGEEAACVCKPGFTFDPSNIKLGCVDINECDTNYGPAGLCGQRAICTNVPGSYRCHCPNGYSGDAYRYCEDINECDRKFGVFGQCGELAVCNNTAGGFTCTCAPGYSGDPKTKCNDIDECSTKFGPNGKCGVGAICTNTPGRFTCRCPDGYSGDPQDKCIPDLPSCSSSSDCDKNQVCQAGRCHCPFANQHQGSGEFECKHPCDKTECGAHATCQLDAENQPLCVCASGYMAPSDGRSGCVDVNECIQGITLSGITPISALTSGQGSVALGPGVGTALNTSSIPCGRNALCRNHPGSFDCICPPGYSGNAYEACQLDVRNQEMTTTRTPFGSENNQTSTPTVLPSGASGNYQQEPRTSSCSENCPRGYVCSEGQCVKPDSCRENQDCRSTMSCEHVNSMIGFQCVNVCELNLCGPEARCTPLNHKPICSCNSSAGYAGDPYDLTNGCRLQTPHFGSNNIMQQQQQTTSSEFNQHSSSIVSHQERLDSHRTTSSHMEGDTSTVSLGDSLKTKTTTQSQHRESSSSYLEGISNLNHQNYDQQTSARKPNQPTDGYELPLPTTPILPQFDKSTTKTSHIAHNQSVSLENQNASLKSTTDAPVAILTSPRPQQVNSQEASMLSTQRQQQSATTQSLFTPKRRVTSTSTQAPQLHPSNSSLNRLDNVNESYQKQQMSSEMHNEMVSQNQQQQQNDQEIDSIFSQFSNKSAIVNGNSNNKFVLLHQQITCTNDQHCPGNLFCLSQADGSSSVKSNQKTCGCPVGYRREADYCYMHRVNCTSSAVCKAREECIPSQILQQYYAAATYGSQQFALSGSQQISLDDLQAPGVCICPRGYKLTVSGIACIDRNECDEGTPCAIGAICQNKIGSYECVCPQGTVGDPYTKTCEPLVKHECHSNVDCPTDRECDLNSHKCVSPCYVCGPRAICTATNHAAMCLCPPRYTGNAIDLVYGCQEPLPTTIPSSPAPISSQSPQMTTPRQQPSTAVGVPVTTMLPSISSSTHQTSLSSTTLGPVESTTPESVEFRTIPPSDLFVMCLADGIQVEVQLGGFDGIIYVKGHSQDPKCRKLVSSTNPNEFVDFKVQFGHCDLVHRDGEAGFVLVIQKHPKLVTYRARAYHVKCVYNTGERTVTLGFNVSMITTSGTIANTGPPPTCLMSITAVDGREVTSAEIGQDLLLRVDVQPDSIYGGFARSCEAKTMDDEGEYRYEVTDANGCATDPSIFSDWKYDQHTKSLVARFNAFKFPSSNNLRFQCNIRVCFGSCPAVNCNGIDAYGKRRRRREVGDGDLSFNTTDDEQESTPTDELIVTDAFKEGALREEIMVQSNAILTFDKKESSLPQSRAQVEDIEFVCLPRLGMVLSVALASLVGLLALAIATSCWMASKRKRRSQSHGPLPHPANFPNPLLRSSSVSTLRESIYGP